MELYTHRLNILGVLERSLSSITHGQRRIINQGVENAKEGARLESDGVPLNTRPGAQPFKADQPMFYIRFDLSGFT